MPPSTPEPSPPAGVAGEPCSRAVSGSVSARRSGPRGRSATCRSPPSTTASSSTYPASPAPPLRAVSTSSRTPCLRSAFQPRLRVRERRHPKLYRVDPGLVRAVKELHGPVALLEGRVLHLLRAHAEEGGPFEGLHYRAPDPANRNGVDFLARRGGEPAAVAVRSQPRCRTGLLPGLRAVVPHCRRDRRVVHRPPGARCGPETPCKRAPACSEAAFRAAEQRCPADPGCRSCVIIGGGSRHPRGPVHAR